MWAEDNYRGLKGHSINDFIIIILILHRLWLHNLIVGFPEITI